MTGLWWGTCMALALGGIGAPAFAAEIPWLTYSNSSEGFAIQYPSTTHPETLQDKEPNLVSRVAFGFEQSFQKGQDSGFLKFRFQISLWRNTNQLSAELWAKEHTNAKLTSAVRPMRVANRQGVVVKTTNLAWSSVKIFVADRDSIYELSYTDIASNEILSKAVRSHWTGIFNGMLDSFKLVPDGKPK
jgi:hypothetical protein